MQSFSWNNPDIFTLVFLEGSQNLTSFLLPGCRWKACAWPSPTLPPLWCLSAWLVSTSPCRRPSACGCAGMETITPRSQSPGWCRSFFWSPLVSGWRSKGRSVTPRGSPGEGSRSSSQLFISLLPRLLSCSSYYDQMCGLCGDYDDDPNNDFTKPDGALVGNVNDFGNSWQTDQDEDDSWVCSSSCSSSDQRTSECMRPSCRRTRTLVNIIIKNDKNHLILLGLKIERQIDR